MEGFLQKLPPAGNTFRGWKRRWFRLVVVISNTQTENDGPLVLEYYDKPESPKPKGVINLGKAQKISRVDPADERAKKLSKVCWDWSLSLPIRPACVALRLAYYTVPGLLCDALFGGCLLDRC